MGPGHLSAAPAGDAAPAAADGLAPRDIIALGEGELRMLDQRLLPGERVTLRLTAWPEVVEAIRDMAIRGAPAIGVAGAMGVALAAQNGPHGDLAALREEVARAAAALRDARPTAVNLAWAVDAQARLAAAHPGPSGGAGRPTWPAPRAGCTTTRCAAAS